jgi:hypothetical protein
MATSCALAPSRPAASPERSSTPAADPDVRKALLAYANAQACPKLVDHFEPLGSAIEGSTPNAHEGRWWIRQCTTHIDGDAITANVRGPLWLWIDRKSSGFELAQYVVFLADVTVTGTLNAGYDSVNDAALVWLTITDPSKIMGRSIGHAQPRPAGLGILLNVITLGSTQQMANESARNKIAKDIPNALRDRLNHGMTIVVDLKTEQVSGEFGIKSHATIADLPFPSTRDTLVNERQVLRPSPLGYQVVGPIDPLPRANLDLKIEQGEGIRFRTACVDQVKTWFSPMERGGWPGVVAPEDDEGSDVRERSTTRVIRPPPCRFYLITRTLKGTAQVAIRLTRPDESSAPKGDVTVAPARRDDLP